MQFTDGEIYAKDKIFTIPTITKRFQEYIKDNISLNTFVGKDVDYIKNAIPGVGKPTAKKILDIVNDKCGEDLKKISKAVDILK